MYEDGSAQALIMQTESQKWWKQTPYPHSIITHEHSTVDPICVCFQRKNFLNTLA